MQIDIDFEVYKQLTNLRETEDDTYNEVIRRLLKLPASEIAPRIGEVDIPGLPAVGNALKGEASGVWFSNIFFPNGTVFRATYKGKAYSAHIRNSEWIDQLGQVKTSPSDAAGAISGTNVNGWRFWFFKRPHDEDWARMDTLRR